MTGPLFRRLTLVATLLSGCTAAPAYAQQIEHIETTDSVLAVLVQTSRVPMVLCIYGRISNDSLFISNIVAPAVLLSAHGEVHAACAQESIGIAAHKARFAPCELPFTDETDPFENARVELLLCGDGRYVARVRRPLGIDARKTSGIKKGGRANTRPPLQSTIGERVFTPRRRAAALLASS